MPQGHQAALPCCVTASTFPHCTEGFFWVILSCHLPERPGRSHLEWCSGHEKVVTVSPRACQFLEGSQLCSLTVKGTAVEACSVTQAHLLVVLPSILCLTPCVCPSWGGSGGGSHAHWSLPEQSPGETAMCRSCAHVLQVPWCFLAFQAFRCWDHWLEVMLLTKSSQLVPYYIFVNLVCGRDPTPQFYGHNKCWAI